MAKTCGCLKAVGGVEGLRGAPPVEILFEASRRVQEGVVERMKKTQKLVEEKGGGETRWFTGLLLLHSKAGNVAAWRRAGGISAVL